MGLLAFRDAWARAVGALAAVFVAPVVAAAALEAEITADSAATDVADCATADEAYRAGDEAAGYSANCGMRCPAGGVCTRAHGDDSGRGDCGFGKRSHR
ncbi:exported protein of unknown function [Hyphomicrobium sp. 1Nfss2.1]